MPLTDPALATPITTISPPPPPRRGGAGTLSPLSYPTPPQTTDGGVLLPTSTDPAEKSKGHHHHQQQQRHHQRRALRRQLANWRSVDRAAVPIKGDERVPTGEAQQSSLAVKPAHTYRSHNMAERDPHSFFRLLSDKLQRLLDVQNATDRLDRLMTEVGCFYPW